MTQSQESQSSTSTGVKVALMLLFLLVLVSLGLNAYLIWQLNQARQQAVNTVNQLQPQIQETFRLADEELEAFQNTTLQFTIDVNENVPIQTEVPFNETVEVPVQMSVPFEEEFATTIMVDPFGSGFTVPMDVVVPIEMEFPIDEVVPITVEQTVAISTSVPLNLSVPIDVAIEETDLAPYIERLREGLGSFEETVNETLSTVE